MYVHIPKCCIHKYIYIYTHICISRHICTLCIYTPTKPDQNGQIQYWMYTVRYLEHPECLLCESTYIVLQLVGVVIGNQFIIGSWIFFIGSLLSIIIRFQLLLAHLGSQEIEKYGHGSRVPFRSHQNSWDIWRPKCLGYHELPLDLILSLDIHFCMF